MRHGTHHAYSNLGCRCEVCVAAERARWRCQRPPQKVSAEACRQHLLELQSAGLGSPAIAASSDVSPGRIIAIRNGAVQWIWKRTADRILKVTSAGIADGARISASRAQHQLRWLLDEGYTREDLARELGYARSSLCNLLYVKRITARTALRIDKMYRKAQVARLGVAA